MATKDDVTNKITELIDESNAVTQAEDTNLSDAVARLAEGYGGGGLPEGGEVGDVLTKTEDGAEWAAPSGGGMCLLNFRHVINSKTYCFSLVIPKGVSIENSTQFFDYFEGKASFIPATAVPNYSNDNGHDIVVGFRLSGNYANIVYYSLDDMMYKTTMLISMTNVSIKDM